MVRVSMASISETSAYGHYLDTEFVITDVIADLFQAAHHRKICDRVSEDHLSGHCKSGGNTRHILFCYSGIQESPGKLLAEFFQHREADIAADQPDTRIFCSKLA
jgi:hypothetical protein